jgi:hypothetical protein
MRLDFYTGERERFLYFDTCGCTDVTSTFSTTYTFNYEPCCLPVSNVSIDIPPNGTVRVNGVNLYGPYAPPGIIFTNVNTGGTPEDSCNECFKYNYKLVNCIDSTVIYTNYLECPDCINYINQLAYTYLEPNPCWYVTVTNEPVGPITLVEINLEAYCEQCEAKCYTVTGTGVITYFDGYGELSTAYAPSVICSSSYPSVVGTNNEIFTNSLFCDNRNPCAYYYRLTNCVTEEQILSNEPDLAFPYALNETVKLAEYPGACWTIEQFPIVN